MVGIRTAHRPHGRHPHSPSTAWSASAQPIDHSEALPVRRAERLSANTGALQLCVCVCVRACVRSCVRVRACVRTRAHACARVRVRERAGVFLHRQQSRLKGGVDRSGSSQTMSTSPSMPCSDRYLHGGGGWWRIDARHQSTRACTGACAPEGMHARPAGGLRWPAGLSREEAGRAVARLR